MKSRIFNIIWIAATLAVFAAGVSLLLYNSRKNMEDMQHKEEEMDAFYVEEGITTEGIDPQPVAPDENAEHIVTDGDVLTVGALQIRVLDYRMINALSDIPNDTLVSVIREGGGLEDRFMYGYYELELANAGDSAFSLRLNAIDLGMLDAKGEVLNFLEPMYFEYCESDRCIEPGSTELVLQPGETYQTGIVGLQTKEEIEDISYCLIYDPFGMDPFDMSDDDIFYLFLQ